MLILLGGWTSCIIGAPETKELPSFVSGSNGDFASTSLLWRLECLQTGGDGAGEHPREHRTAVNNEDCRPVSKVQDIAKASCRASCLTPPLTTETSLALFPGTDLVESTIKTNLGQAVRLV